MLGPSEEMQDDLIEEITWRLALQSVLEEEERERLREEVVEDEKERKEEEVLDLFQWERPHSDEGRWVEEAIVVQAKDEVEVEEACTGPILHVLSHQTSRSCLAKTHLQCLFAKPRPHQHQSLLVDAMVVNRIYLIWFGAMRQEQM
ncbi:unnamed protein product [Linum trigynum]|uniref:Uncharacterized protein n=1 Tax=Linum trigynum TaxID=586398 RepID=A0AAV2E7K4_9ROSI